MLHPFLLAVFPVLYLWSQNIEHAVSLLDVLPSLLVVLGATGLVFALAWLGIGRDAARAGIVTSIAVLLTLTYGFAYRILESARLFGIGVQHRFLIPILLVLAVAGIVGTVRRGWKPEALTRGLNLVALALVIMNLGSIAWFAVRAPGADAVRAPAGTRGQPANPTGPARDIYYVVLDRYGSERVLREHLGFDNSSFTQALRDRGFYVADASRSNYPRTAQSMASSLNMDYLDRLVDVARAGPGDWTPVYHLIRRHQVGRLLSTRGYRYVHIGSWWEPTADNPMADVNMRFGGLSEFERVVYETTLLAPLSEMLFGGERGAVEYERVRWQLEALDTARGIEGPKFVLAHILSPHEPFVFDRRGRFVPQARRARGARSTLYADQVRYLNRRLLAFLDRLLVGPEETWPIVILQADEGPFEAPGRWAGKSARLLDRKFGILNAYYLPGEREPGLYHTITPVNSFRILLSRVFGATLPRLPDRNIVWPDQRHLYEFTDVTDRLPAPRDDTATGS